MLEGLNNTDWNKIRHRHGSASNIPPLLFKLQSKVHQDQSQAIHELFSHLWFQGKVYEATGRTVPFLYELLESPACVERFAVLWLLASIASSGFKPAPLHEDLPEMVWHKNAQRAVRQGLKTVLRLLNDRDKDLRLPAVLLLAALRDEAPQIKPLLLSLLADETSLDTRAGLGLALALLGDFRTEAFMTSIFPSSSAALAKDLAKACVNNPNLSATAYKTIHLCFAETLSPKDKEWLLEERDLLANPNLEADLI